ncbi:MAG: thioredoxin family protein [Bacteroidota bacterium]|nr:thioredoxin family protein [Bacteroidota bacterium]
MTILEIKSEAEYLEISNNAPASLFYFSHDDCNVCKVLKPKVHELLQEKYPKIPMYYVNIHKSSKISGQRSIFAVPTILVYMDSQEIIRKSRNIGLAELDELIAKPYSLLFDQ